MRRLAWGLTFLGSLMGGVTFLTGFMLAGNADQYTASAAMGLAWAVLPYTCAYACDRWVELGREPVVVKPEPVVVTHAGTLTEVR